MRDRYLDIMGAAAMACIVIVALTMLLVVAGAVNELYFPPPSACPAPTVAR